MTSVHIWKGCEMDYKQGTKKVWRATFNSGDFTRVKQNMVGRMCWALTKKGLEKILNDLRLKYPDGYKS